jgi:hypothetical protein
MRVWILKNVLAVVLLLATVEIPDSLLHVADCWPVVSLAIVAVMDGGKQIVVLMPSGTSKFWIEMVDFHREFTDHFVVL